jgi:hypothetical protein
MHLPQVNYLAVLVSGIAIFMLGGLWYSPVLFAKKWIALMGMTEEEIKAAAGKVSMPVQYLLAFLCGLISAWVLAIVLNHFTDLTALRGAEVGILCWLGFAGVTSYATAIFSMKPKGLWLINSGFNLVSFVIAGIILAVWR